MEFKEKEALDFSYKIRKKILEMSFNAGAASAHIGGALSCADIISVIFSNFLNFENLDFRGWGRALFFA